MIRGQYESFFFYQQKQISFFFEDNMRVRATNPTSQLAPILDKMGQSNYGHVQIKVRNTIRLTRLIVKGNIVL